MRILYHPRRILGFETYVAPEGFDRKAQPVDIYDVFERYYRNHRTAKYIYSVEDVSSEHAFRGGTSYRYSYSLGGETYYGYGGNTLIKASSMEGTFTSIEVLSTSGFPPSGKICTANNNIGTDNTFVYTSKDETHFYGDAQYLAWFGNPYSREINSVVQWGNTSTKKYVIVHHTSMAMMGANIGQSNVVWAYFGNYISSVFAGYNASVRYIHIHKLDNITSYPYTAHYVTKLTGVLHLSKNPLVTSLPQNFCTHSSLLTGTLVIPSNITYIAQQAFWGGSGCTGLVLENGLTYIGVNAFQNWTELNGTLTIPNSCITIESGSFYNCNKLDAIDLGTGVQTIGNSAFQACSQLSGTLVLPDSLTTIGTLAFYGCTSFSGTLTIPLNVTSIGQGAFGDDNFTDIDVTANSRYEDVDDVLYEISTRTALHSVKGDTGTITFQTNTLIIGDYCCLRNQRTGTLTVPDSVTRVGISAFYDCDGFTAISLEASSSSLATIDDYAFSHCSNLAGTLTLPNSVTLVDAGAFRDDVLITGIVFSSALVTIGADAFRQMTAISENLVLPNSVETIGARAFYNNTARTGTLTLGTGLKTIGSQAFGNTPLTGTLSIPSLVTAIGEAAFWNNNFSAISSAATGFTVSDYVLYDETTSGQITAHTSARGYAGTLTLKTGTTSILYYCFFNNTNRTGTVSILSTVTLIRQQAFESANALTGLAFSGTPTIATIESQAFYNCKALTGTLTLPASLGTAANSIAANAFTGSTVANRPQFTVCNSYNATQPGAATNAFAFRDVANASVAIPLHIPTGSTSYIVAPWTNTAIFSSVTADL